MTDARQAVMNDMQVANDRLECTARRYLRMFDTDVDPEQQELLVSNLLNAADQVRDARDTFSKVFNKAS